MKVIIGILLLALVQFAQAQKVEIGDGTKIPFGMPVYSTEAEIVRTAVKNSGIKVPGESAEECGPNDSFRIGDSVDGSFTSANANSRVYLYSDCYKSGKKRIQGIIALANEQRTAHFAYLNASDVKLVKVSDLDGNGLDELGIYSHRKIAGGYWTSIRIMELGPKGIKKFGSFELENEKDILIAFKLYAENGDPPRFYASSLRTDGKSWKVTEPEKEIKLGEDTASYVEDKSRKGLSKHIWAWTFLIQMVGFVGLIGFVIYELIASARSTETSDAQTGGDESAGMKSKVDAALPKLKPINCESCGAGVPLNEGEITCPNCGTVTSAPADYFDVAKVRNEINQKIRHAAAYIRRAAFLSSSWFRYATLLSAIWLIVDIVAVLVLFNNGNLGVYQSYFASKAVFALGIFSICFWIVSLLFGFAIWGPGIKKAMPVVELKEDLGHAETARCMQCGGAIQYRPNDLATVCGYCGVETYRVNLAWKLRKLSNTADQKANFSLLDAKKSVEDAIWEITGTPRMFAFLLILIAIFGGCIWLIGAVYDSLPPGIRDVIDFIGDIFGAL